MASVTTPSHVYPLGSSFGENGRLQIGGCDAIELAERFGTPAYLVAEADLRARARAFVDAFHAAGHDDFEVLFASKAFPATAVMALFAQEGLGCDVASAGELHLALRAGFDPAKLVLHGNARDDSELQAALDAGVGHIVVDSHDDIDRLERLTDGARPRQPVLLRVTPGVSGDTHEKISTGQADSKFGFGMDEASANAAGAAPLQGEFDRIAALKAPGDVLAEMARLHTMGVPAGFESFFIITGGMAPIRTALLTRLVP